MYEDHPACRQPADEALIWRYVDFTKFVSMLDTQALYFCRADQLGDKYEGAYPQTSFDTDVASIGPGGIVHHWDAETKGRVRQDAQRLRLTMFINCWHMNEHQSAAMWKLYLKSNEGIAIRSTFGRLKESLLAAPETVFAGQVNYIDYEKDQIPLTNVMYPFIHKRVSFAHETELRAMYWHDVNYAAVVEGREKSEWGYNIRADLGTLLETVFVAPTAPGWLRDLTESVLHKYGLMTPVIKSDLEMDPFW